MRAALVLAVVLASRAFAGPIGADDPHAASPTGFPGAYLGSIQLALNDEARYGSRLLDALDEHLQAVCVMTSQREVSGYLEQSAGSDGVAGLRRVLGREALDPAKASALLLAEALSRPEQFREVLDGLESEQPGVGRQAAKLLSGAKGTGQRKLLAALRDAPRRHRRGEAEEAYYSGGRIAELFDAASVDGPEGLVLADPEAAGPPRGAHPHSRLLDARAERP
ncbi:MAG TPA: hypothetical protein VN915_06020 [Elusimicrobiota bacterium]|nr:hypothetical protein [Elusimicrobiota bacterium]